MTTVVGGVYAERCIEPFWDDVYGSAGRAAAAMSGTLPHVRLVTYRAADLEDGIEGLASAYGLSVDGPVVPKGVAFEYLHSLSTPTIAPRPGAILRHPDLDVEDDVVLRFGMMEGSARATARVAVYDPQSAFDPRPFAENGSRADRVALVLNRSEGELLTGQDDPSGIAATLLGRGDAEVVVVKMGGHGCLVAQAGQTGTIPAYKSNEVWKIGSGDVFSGMFALHWAVEGRLPEEAADLASRAANAYCGNRALPIPPSAELAARALSPVMPGSGRVYIAAPFFNLAERWLVEEVRSQLQHMGVDVFSPLHDVGPGPAEHVAPLDIAGLDGCQAVLAILNGGDAGTVFEVGYAVGRGVPVVALAQNVRPEDLKMIAGTGCLVVDDLVSAIYHAVWALP